MKITSQMVPLVFLASTTPFLLLAQEPPLKAPKQHMHYSIEQAVSDKAQLHTIAFDGLAFLTGDFGGDTFLPPGKVSD